VARRTIPVMAHRTIPLGLFLAISAWAQAAGPAYPVLTEAYARLQAREYESAIAGFRRALELEPDRSDVRKDLAYTLLKTGETELARDVFGDIMERDPADVHSALEYAFLCYETRRTREARLVFDRARKTAAEPARTTAEQAFQNIDRPLAEGIARWSDAVEREPENFSARKELAELLENRNELAAAAQHYREAWRLKPTERSLLLALGRVHMLAGNRAGSMIALLAASRGGEPRTADTARTLLPDRYPFAYEFEGALELDPANTELRREYAYLLLELGERTKAEDLFSRIVEEAPADLLSAAQLGFLLLQREQHDAARPLLERVLDSADPDAAALQDRVRTALGLPPGFRRRAATEVAPSASGAREMGMRSYNAGYLRDALKYLSIANEEDPLDFNVILKLGWTHNQLSQDAQAMKWFDLARRSPDAAIAAEARSAYANLAPDTSPLRTSFWTLPFYSSRWKQAFAYSQVKSELSLGAFPLRPYLSLRLVGDSSGLTGSPYPQFLSESAVIFGAGLATPRWKGLMAWGEAGTSVAYRERPWGQSRALPDYRGGLSFARGFGKLPGTSQSGAYLENHEDAVFVSRFDNSVLLYSQNRVGYHAAGEDSAIALYMNFNATAGTRRQYWANFVEAGPGVRFRLPFFPRGMMFSVDGLRGAHTLNTGNPRRPNYYDFRAGFWYAFTR
jgi:tetratricopeptide (TPR) repeat protein